MSELHVLLLPGGSDPGPWHWQRWLAARAREAGAVVTRWADADGLGALRAGLSRVPPDAELAVVAHRGGADAWLRHVAAPAPSAPAATAPRRADRVLLVAPPPSRPGSSEIDAPALRHAGGPTRLVVGEADPVLPERAAAALARRLRVELDVLPGVGELDTAAGYGPWPALLRWVLYGSVPVADRVEAAPRTAGCSPVPEGAR
ncbi:alpha/beta hydrolase [Saccharopolyspora sp. MS10]|uniref:alpha/beta hydrolase n=1 Tax=Saccharopolyspora sp. MS10 TaxID=3385973 RepID=UPI0039A18801